MARPPLSAASAVILLTLALPTALAGAGVRAQTLCSQPVEPICATAIPATEPNAATDQAVARSRCIEDAETYREKLEEYRHCLEESLTSAKASVAAANKFIQCLETGKPDCRLRVTQ